MNTKKIVFFTSLVTLAFVFVINNPIMFGFCQNIIEYETGAKYCSGSQILPEVASLLCLFLGGSLLLLSLITYKMRDEAFLAWWRFARWWVPVIVVVTLLLQNAGGGGGMGISGAVSGAFDALILGVLYAILILTSLFKIIRAYSQAKGTW